jgi:hypothetical protein
MPGESTHHIALSEDQVRRESTNAPDREPLLLAQLLQVSHNTGVSRIPKKSNGSVAPIRVLRTAEHK